MRTISQEENIFYADCINRPAQQNILNYYASKLCSTSKSLLENIHSRILDVQDITDHKKLRTRRCTVSADFQTEAKKKNCLVKLDDSLLRDVLT